jgi:hypothetical protein
VCCLVWIKPIAEEVIRGLPTDEKSVENHAISLGKEKSWIIRHLVKDCMQCLGVSTEKPAKNVIG